jgi:hypothetical protein
VPEKNGSERTEEAFFSLDLDIIKALYIASLTTEVKTRRHDISTSVMRGHAHLQIVAPEANILLRAERHALANVCQPCRQTL